MRVLGQARKGILGCLVAVSLYLLTDDESCSRLHNAGDKPHRLHRCMYIDRNTAGALETGSWTVIMDARRSPAHLYIAEVLLRFGNVAILHVDSLGNAEVAARLGFNRPGQVVCLRPAAGSSNSHVLERKIPIYDVVDIYLLGVLLRMRWYIRRRLLSSSSIYLNFMHLIFPLAGKAFT